MECPNGWGSQDEIAIRHILIATKMDYIYRKYCREWEDINLDVVKRFGRTSYGPLVKKSFQHKWRERVQRVKILDCDSEFWKTCSN